jgi:hypothetical protein
MHQPEPVGSLGRNRFDFVPATPEPAWGDSAEMPDSDEFDCAVAVAGCWVLYLAYAD